MVLKFNKIASDQVISKEILDEFNLSYSSKEDFDPIEEARVLSLSFKEKINKSNYNSILEPFDLANIAQGDEFQAENKDLVLKLLSFFIYYLKFYLDLFPENEIPKFKGLSRMVAPPKEAYKYLGHNKMDIGESKKGYALLHE